MRFGTVGKPLPGTEVGDRRGRRDPDPRARTCSWATTSDPEATTETLTPRRLAAHRRPGRRSTTTASSPITGRKKDLIITSSGKNITPVNIESVLRESRYITEAVVYGDNRPYLVAMLTLDRDESVKLAERARHRRRPGDDRAATQPCTPRSRRRSTRSTRKLARIEQIKRFAILDHDLTQADGELTPTLKVKRAVVYAKYADMFDGLYAREDASHEPRASPAPTQPGCTWTGRPT